MATFYAQYPAAGVTTTTVQTVQGEGTAGTPVGGLLTIQGDPAGTPVPISGNITASSLAVAPTGGAVPASADYVGMNVGGTLTGITGNGSGLFTVINSALPAGTAIIGKVGIDQTTPGTTNGVQVNAALPAGSNIIGNIRIDQTTPGTTNGVQVNAALPAGSNSIGNIGTVSTVTGVTTVSTVTAVTGITNTVNVTGTGSTGAPATGILTVQGNASGVAIPVTVSSTSPTTVTTAVWQAEGSIAFGSITNAYQTVFTPSAATKIIFMRNNTNASMSVSMDAGSTLNFVLDAGDQVSIDFQANALVSATSAIQVKYTVGAPTSGSVRINGVH